MNYELYRKKVLGCWLGKSVGGTLGQPWEGKHPPYELTFYDPIPDEMIPNDDLDLQVGWLQRIIEEGLPIDRHMLAGAWKDHIENWPDEYGTNLRNQDYLLMPPLTGAHDANFPDGMGAAIRTEIWACLAPGDPKLAAHFAREDACCDHTGNGVWAAEFLATIESAAFVESDRDTLLDLGLAAIPPDCALAAGIAMVREMWPKVQDRDAVLAEILKRYDTRNFTDVKVNLPIIVLAWLSGGNDFSKCILDAVNCGQDADCTCATLGAILGLIDPECIDDKWLEPIGHDLVLSPFMTGMAPARTIDEMSDQIAGLCPQVLEYYGSEVRLEVAEDSAGSGFARPTGTRPAGACKTNQGTPARPAGAEVAAGPVHLRLPADTARRLSAQRDAHPRDALVQTSPLDITVRYPDHVRQAPGVKSDYQLTVCNPLERPVEATINLRPPLGWELEGETRIESQALAPLESLEMRFRAVHNISGRRPFAERLRIEQSVDGIPCMCDAGLLVTMPLLRWTRQGELPEGCPESPVEAELVETDSHFLDASLADETHSVCYRARVSFPYHAILNLVALCVRPIRVWLDGELLVDHKGGPHAVPPIYRQVPGTANEKRIKRGVHEWTLAIAPGEGDPGQAFWAIGLDHKRGIPGRWYSKVEFEDPRG